MSRTKRLNTLWTKHLKEKKEREDFEAYLKNTRQIFEVMTSLIEDQLSKMKTTDQDYEKAAWPYLQADRQGQIRAYNYIKELIDL
jgi:hypothetical protein|tara:strand:- start:6059 stop:6313 length:255 start_codon:yes stop_codon:yes gene_type:complete